MNEDLGPKRVAVVTGTRAEFGLLVPVMRAIGAHPDLELLVIACGAHLLGPAETINEVRAAFTVHATIPMQRANETGRLCDALALGRGVIGMTETWAALDPQWVVVLGDRIEALAAAASASVAGLPVAHIHGGDRAEGVADEAMRHAITKLAHLHLAATEQSSERIRRMGEPEDSVYVVGSPAIDGLADVAAMDDAAHAALGSPNTLVLFHPIGRGDAAEQRVCENLLGALAGRRALALHPNFDPGRGGVMLALKEAEARGEIQLAEHLARPALLSLLKRLARDGGVIVGNSSGALIEGAGLGCRAVDVGARQSGREAAGNVVRCGESREAISEGLRAALGLSLADASHPFGDGCAGQRIAELLAASDDVREAPAMVRKHCVF